MGDSTKHDDSRTRSQLSCYAFRLTPGQDITEELIKFVAAQRLEAAFILTCTGSVTCATLRLANADATNKNEIKHVEGRHEITSLVGTIGKNGSYHLHTTLGDADGKAVSGHVMGNMKVFTTAEIVLGVCDDLIFTRAYDRNTGFNELIVNKK